MVYREDVFGVWRLRPIDGSPDELVVDARWDDVRISADGWLAARSVLFGTDRLCVAPPDVVRP